MNINTKKGLILIAFGIIGVSVISFMISFLSRLIGLYQIIYYLGFLSSIARLGFVVLGILQILGKFNIDQYFDMNKYLKTNDIAGNYDETFFENQNTENKITEVKTNLKTEIKKNINQLNLNNMEYKVEQIGAEFSNKGIKNLEGRFNSFAEQGYKFHSVFEVQKPGCLGLGKPSITYLAVYVKE